MTKSLLSHLIFQTNLGPVQFFDKGNYFNNRALGAISLHQKLFWGGLCLTALIISLLVIAPLWLKYMENAYNRLPEVKIYSCIQFSHSVVSGSLRPHGLQHTRHSCPTPTPGAHRVWYKLLKTKQANIWTKKKKNVLTRRKYLLLLSHFVISDSFVTPWTVACQALLSIEFPRQEYWSVLPFLLQGIFLTQGSSLHLLHCQGVSLPLRHQRRR